jgi:tRNA-Thr(GGU) m(6)t(6)A37 methyltransferase TsaA
VISLDVKEIGVVRDMGGGRHVLAIRPMFAEGLEGLQAGIRIQVLFWMHRLEHADRRLLKVHPGGVESNPRAGVFALRSCRRPNPIGVTIVDVIEVNGANVMVSGLDAMDGAPVIDIKAAGM